MTDPRTGCVRAVTCTTVATWRMCYFIQRNEAFPAPVHQPPSKQSIALYGLVASILQEGPWDGAGLEAAWVGNDGGFGARGQPGVPSFGGCEASGLAAEAQRVPGAMRLVVGWGDGGQAGDAHLPGLSGGSQVPAPATQVSVPLLVPIGAGHLQGLSSPCFLPPSLFLKMLCPRSPHLSFVH